MVWQFWGRAARDVLSLTAQDVFYCPRAARLRGSHKVGFPQMSLESFIASTSSSAPPFSRLSTEVLDDLGPRHAPNTRPAQMPGDLARANLAFAKRIC